MAVAFTDVTVVPMDGARHLANRTVLVRAGRIEAIGPAASLPVPADALVIAGRGRWLMPGLADMHVHLHDERLLPIFLANGVTTVRNMWGRPDHLALRDRIDAGTLPGPTIVTAGPIYDGEPPVWPDSTVVTDAAAAERLVAAQCAAGYDFVKVYDNLAPAAYHGLVATARGRGVPVAGHVPRAVGLRGVLAAGQASIEHLSGYVSPLGRVTPAVEELGPRGVAEATAAAGAWNCPTLVLRERMVSVAEAEALLAQPEMRFVPAWVRALWDAQTDDTIRRAPAEDWGRVRRGNALRTELVRALRDAGARLLLGTDTPNRLVTPGFALHEELRHLVAAGLTPYEALRAGTADAAAFLGEGGVWGTVAPGARADLLLLDGDPLADVAHAARPAGVMARGRWLPRAQLARMLEGAPSE